MSDRGRTVLTTSGGGDGGGHPDSKTALYKWAAEQSELAKTNPAKFVREVFGPTFFTAENFLPLVSYWMAEYTQSKDRLQCFVEMFKDICFGSGFSLEIYPNYINVFHNIRLTVPLERLTAKVLILLSIFARHSETFFATRKKHFQGASFSDCYHSPSVPIGAVTDAIFYAFVKSTMNKMPLKEICEGLGLLAGRLMALPQMVRFGHLVYQCAVSYKTKLL
jgi:hypothetical protein